MRMQKETLAAEVSALGQKIKFHENRMQLGTQNYEAVLTSMVDSTGAAVGEKREIRRSHRSKQEATVLHDSHPVQPNYAGRQSLSSEGVVRGGSVFGGQMPGSMLQNQTSNSFAPLPGNVTVNQSNSGYAPLPGNISMSQGNSGYAPLPGNSASNRVVSGGNVSGGQMLSTQGTAGGNEAGRQMLTTQATGGVMQQMGHIRSNSNAQNSMQVGRSGSLMVQDSVFNQGGVSQFNYSDSKYNMK